MDQVKGRTVGGTRNSSFALVAALLLAVVFATPSQAQSFTSQQTSARSYSYQEDRAWFLLRTFQNSSSFARNLGKRESVKLMKQSCNSLTSGVPYRDLAQQWIDNAFRAFPADEGGRLFYMSFGSSLIAFAVQNICPQHRKQLGI
jgi:hypothetical protein